MRERKFRKLVTEYPNLVDGRFAISHTQALNIINEHGGFPTLEEIICRAKGRSDLPDTAWEAFDRILMQKNVRKNRNYKTAGFSTIVPKVRLGGVVVLAMIIILASFFTFTPSGRALAKQLYGFVIDFFDTGYTVTPTTDTAIQGEPQTAVPYEEKYYSTYEELKEMTGRDVFRLDFTDNMTQESLMTVNSNAGFMVISVFSDSYKKNITIIQEYDIKTLKSGNTDVVSKEWIGYLADGTQVRCYIDGLDGTLCALGEWNNSLLRIYVDEGLDYNSFIF